MKKLFFTALLAVSVVVSAFAADKINSVTVNNFEAAFKKASNVSWITRKDFTKATFVLNSVRMEALYSLDGDLIGTSKGVTLEELPVNAKRNFAKKYNSYTVREAIRFEGNDEGAYYISGENEKQSVIFKVSDHNQVSIVKRLKK